MGTPAQQHTGNEAEFRHKTFFENFFLEVVTDRNFFFAKPLSHKLPQLAAAASQYDTWNSSLAPHHHQEAYFRSPSPYKNPLFSATISLGHIDLRPLLRLLAKSFVQEEVEISRRIS